MYSPEDTICRVVDRIWVQFGVEPISLNGVYSFFNFHTLEKYAQNEKLAAQKTLAIKGVHKDLSEITDEWVAKIKAKWGSVFIDQMRAIYTSEVTPYNQNQKGYLYVGNALEDNELIWCFAAGNKLQFSVNQDLKTISYWFDVPGAASFPTSSVHAGDKDYMGFEETSASGLSMYYRAPFWGYLTFGAR